MLLQPLGGGHTRSIHGSRGSNHKILKTRGLLYVCITKVREVTEARNALCSLEAIPASDARFCFERLSLRYRKGQELSQ
jgi:hypothetical protein